MAWRDKLIWLTPSIRKVILLVGFSLFFPSPIYLVAVVAFVPAIFTLYMTVSLLNEFPDGSWKILGFLIGFSFFIILVVLNYLVVCWLEKEINKKIWLWVIMGLIVVLTSVFKLYWGAAADGHSNATNAIEAYKSVFSTMFEK
jgi:hypothetical protein